MLKINKNTSKLIIIKRSENRSRDKSKAVINRKKTSVFVAYEKIQYLHFRKNVKIFSAKLVFVSNAKNEGHKNNFVF